MSKGLIARSRLQHSLRSLALAGASLVAVASLAGAQVAVTTYHNDAQRTGQNLTETILTPGTVNASTLLPLFVRSVDGYVFAQPLYLSAVPIPGKGTHNVVYVATQHNSVYAFDADDAFGNNDAPLWEANLGPSVPNGDVGTDDIVPEIGITGTPVIDPKTGTLYLVAKTKEIVDFLGTIGYIQRLHALDIHSGQEKFGGPVVIQGSVAGVGDGSVSGTVAFNPFRQNQRPALLLANGVVYVGWASHGDNVGAQAPDGTFPEGYHGWVIGFNAANLQPVGIFNTTPNGVTDPSGYPLAAGGIWMGGGGIAADKGGSLYFTTGNGAFDNTKSNYGDSIIRLNVSPSAANILSIDSFFTPMDQLALDDSDADLGSGAVVVLPDSVGTRTHPHLLVGAGKEGTIYVMDRDNMGMFNSAFDAVVQELPHVIGGGSYDTPAFFNNTLYYGGANDAVRAFTLQQPKLANPNYPNGFANPAGLALNGSTTLSGSNLRLTDGNGNEASSAFTTGVVNVSKFSTKFQFQLQPGSTPMADGITFTLQSNSPNALGYTGGSLGYEGIGSSIAVKFDLYNNAGEGVNSTGIYTNGAYPSVPFIDLTGTGIDLHSGDPFLVTMTYDGTTLKVTIKDTVTAASASQSYPIDIPGTLGSSLGFAGFTGGTGGLTAIQDIQSWTYTAPAITNTFPTRFIQSAQAPSGFGFPGSTPSVSANGTQNGIVWALQNDAFGYGGPAVLHAYNASTLAELAAVGSLAGAVKFTVPTVANGKVFVGGQYGLTVFGRADQKTAVIQAVKPVVKRLANGSYQVSVTLANQGGDTANSIKVTGAALGAAGTPSSPALPISVGTLLVAQTHSLLLTFPASAGASHAKVSLTVSGTDVSAGSSGSFSSTLPITLP